MSQTSTPFGFRAELSAELTALRHAQDYSGAFALIDRELPTVFGDHNLPDDLADLLLLNLLAGRKASLMREICGGELIDAQGEHAGWAVSADQREDVVEQILGWYQLALAASGRLLGSATAQSIIQARLILGSELTAMRQDFLGWEEQTGPGGQALPPLPAQLGQVLFSQLWSIGDYAGAEDLLFLVRDLLMAAEVAGGEQGTKDVATQFYSHLLGLSDAQLEGGGLPRAEIQSAMAEFGIGS